MAADRSLVVEIAGAIADGASIDWASVEMGTSDPRHRGLVEQLRVLALLREACRQPARDADPSEVSEPAETLPGSETWAHLQLLEVIGRGSYGLVYRAWDAQLARHVALKLLPVADGTVADEGRLLARVRHPNVVTVHGAQTNDGWVGVWMELVHGRTLEEALHGSGPLDQADAALIGIDVASALTAVHAAGLVHRDVKAQNVMREEGGRILLMDFGTGREQSAVTTGDMAGTPLYMAPELFDGAPASVRSDIYSAGVLLYRLVSRAFPIDAATVSDVRQAHRSGQAVPVRTRVPHLHRDLSAVVECATAHDPTHRFESAAALEAALWQALRSGVARRLGEATALRSRLRRRRWQRFVAAAAGVGVAAAAAVGWADADAQRRRGPAGTFFLSGSGWVATAAGTELRVVASNPHEAFPIAVFDDGATVMTAGGYAGNGHRLVEEDGEYHPMGVTPGLGGRLCCWFDGTTDGRNNYSVRSDAYGGEASMLFRFQRDWSSPQAMFTLSAGVSYTGVTHDPETDGFWLSTRGPDGGVIELWDRTGRKVRSFSGVPRMTALGLDPSDRTLWAVGEATVDTVVTLTNFSRDGRVLDVVELVKPEPLLQISGGDFSRRR